MPSPSEDVLRNQLIDRRQKLEMAISRPGPPAQLQDLLHEVDAALDRMDKGTFGQCEVCQGAIEPDRLMADPLIRVCLEDLNPSEQRALAEDLEMASKIQMSLLPKPDLTFQGWQISNRYQAAGPVSGDYCDVMTGEDGSLYFMLGDVSGKGVSASMLMAHLSAMLRALVSVGLPLNQLVARASRVFCESTLPTHFATLVCGRADDNGGIEVCNAGHLPGLFVHEGHVTPIESTGLPLGLFCNEEFTLKKMKLDCGDSLILYTDGLSEAENGSGQDFGVDRLIRLAEQHHSLAPAEMIRACLSDHTTFRSGHPNSDDLTMMVIRRA